MKAPGADTLAQRLRALTQRVPSPVWLRRLVAALVAFPAQVPAALVLAALGCAAVAASSDLANTFHTRGAALIATAIFGCLAAAIACFVAATRSPSHSSAAGRAGGGPDGTFRAATLVLFRLLPRILPWLVYPLLLWALFTATQTLSVLAHRLTTPPSSGPSLYGSDAMFYNHYGALLILHGQNPYAGDHLAAAINYFGVRAYTPLARGRFADVRHYPTAAELDAVIDEYLADPSHPPVEVDPATFHSYPAGAFLVAAPPVWAGQPSLAYSQLLLFLALVAAVLVTMPPGLRLPALLLLLTNVDGVRQIAGGDFEIWPVALLILAWLLRNRSVASALLVGAACAVKQTAWIAAPFYLIWVWREHGRAEALRRLAIMVGAFLLINLPWIVASPGPWLSSLLLPMDLPLLPDGAGLVGLSLAGAAPLFPSAVFSLAELALLAGALVWYARNAARYPFAALALPLLPLLAAWRSPERYFLLLPLLGVAAALLTLQSWGGVSGLLPTRPGSRSSSS